MPAAGNRSIRVPLCREGGKTGRDGANNEIKMQAVSELILFTGIINVPNGHPQRLAQLLSVIIRPIRVIRVLFYRPEGTSVKREIIKFQNI